MECTLFMVGTWYQQKEIPGGSAGKESTSNAGDLGSIPGLGRSPGEGNSYPLQYSGLDNSICKELDTTGQLSLSLSDPPVGKLLLLPLER